ncbi:MAG: bifunctional metallophosphatase/5'-nucleotidase [Oligoflexia bacterium]
MKSTPSIRLVRVFLALSAAIAGSAGGLFTGCANSPSFQAGSRTEKLSDTSGDLQTIAILGMNDFHGALLARELKQPEPHTAGGAAILARHVEILKEVFGPNFLILDGGDQFQGTLESNFAEGKPVVEFFNRLGMSAAAVGNHEFDFGPEGDTPSGTPGSDLRGALKARMSEARYPYLAANIRYKNGRELTDFPNLKPSVVLQSGRLKIGVIGLATIYTPVTTKSENVSDLVFTNAAEATVREAKKLRKQGAHIVVVLAHQGLKCDRMRPEPSLIRRPNDLEGSCEPNDEIPNLVRSIPKGTIDAVIAGHTHQVIHHYLDGIPVIQSGANGLYYNLLYFTWDWRQNRLVQSETAIEGPIPVCEKVFENQGDCNGVRPAPKNGRGSLITPRLHGAKIRAVSDVEAWARQVASSVDSLKKKVVGTAAVNLTHERSREATLGNFITDAMREGLKADIAITNPGGIRAPIESGEIRYEDVYRSFPFDNDVVVLELNHQQLKLLLQVIQSGSRGYFPTSGLKLTLVDPAEPAEGRDLNGDSKIDPWELDRFVSVTLENGRPLEAGRTYRVAIPDFLVNGGDDLGWLMSQIPKNAIHREGAAFMRDVAIGHLTRHPAIGGPDAPLIKPDAPRVVFVKAKPKSSSRSPKKGGKRR